MEVVRFKNGEYSYFTDGISGNVIQGSRADEIVNDPTCVLYSPMMTTCNNGEKTEIWITSLYDNRVKICSRGGDWSNEFCIEIDKMFNICSADFRYNTWHSQWEKKQLSPNEFIKYLNLIEQNGISYVRDMYLELLTQDLNRLRNPKYFNVDLVEPLEKIFDELKRLNSQLEINHEVRQMISHIREVQEKILIISSRMSKVEEHRKLFG